MSLSQLIEDILAEGKTLRRTIALGQTADAQGGIERYWKDVEKRVASYLAIEQTWERIELADLMRTLRDKELWNQEYPELPRAETPDDRRRYFWRKIAAPEIIRVKKCLELTRLIDEFGIKIFDTVHTVMTFPPQERYAILKEFEQVTALQTDQKQARMFKLFLILLSRRVGRLPEQ
jgi:hypothetical protein